MWPGNSQNRQDTKGNTGDCNLWIAFLALPGICYARLLYLADLDHRQNALSFAGETPQPGAALDCKNLLGFIPENLLNPIVSDPLQDVS